MKNEILDEIAGAVGGKIESAGELPDGSGFAVMSYPLPKKHWLYADHDNVPPMPLRMGVGLERTEISKDVVAAARYAIRAATMNGKEQDFDPDAMVQNFVVGLLGYHTADELSSDEWANLSPVPPESKIK